MRFGGRRSAVFLCWPRTASSWYSRHVTPLPLGAASVFLLGNPQHRQQQTTTAPARQQARAVQ
ncbi:hypothetical protein KI387_044240 [Taxus chinensis]|uniref:Uncharacterized protein n=1 Tax=Taxus chinensis TaxID=29808 RepID=A0AA38CB20_TAXCH|nr:hypothetical protein KI387_044240 [Taxus chinensis]